MKAYMLTKNSKINLAVDKYGKNTKNRFGDRQIKFTNIKAQSEKAVFFPSKSNSEWRPSPNIKKMKNIVFFQ